MYELKTALSLLLAGTEACLILDLNNGLYSNAEFDQLFPDFTGTYENLSKAYPEFKFIGEDLSFPSSKMMEINNHLFLVTKDFHRVNNIELTQYKFLPQVASIRTDGLKVISQILEIDKTRKIFFWRIDLAQEIGESISLSEFGASTVYKGPANSILVQDGFEIDPEFILMLYKEFNEVTKGKRDRSIFFLKAIKGEVAYPVKCIFKSIQSDEQGQSLVVAGITTIFLDPVETQCEVNSNAFEKLFSTKLDKAKSGISTRKRTVGIIDDNQINMYILKDLCLRAMLETKTCTSDPEEFISFSKTQPDLLLVDETLPGLNGQEMIQALRSSGFKGIIALMTLQSYSSQRMADLKIDLIIPKPISEASFLNAISEISFN